MSALRAALATEGRKAISARVLRWTTGLLVVSVTALVAGILAAMNLGDPQLTAKLGPVADLEGWPALLAVAAQITAAGVMPALGIGLSWLVGREFAEGTITGLFALPVPRWTIVLAKLVVYLVWTVLVGAALCAAMLLLGMLIGFGMPDPAAWGPLARQIPLTILVGLVATPVAWAATLGRGLLPGIATAIGLLVIAQVMAFTGSGAWFPLIAPALWAIDPGSVTAAQLALVPSIPVVFGGLTLLAWHRLQLDR
ncbi:ABC transporter permease [Microbacterium sp. NEAU-LLC]|uniref:ABC transporter permease n=1 Tax=Microbacterium helvum TaxID=2773713 RepID=A0ABR8NIJ3_9MICO|nr:ABC transporter permease [Microbacterium helvum]MBD3940512.1 ABC transporter permease [Microbacterium helvum]